MGKIKTRHLISGCVDKKFFLWMPLRPINTWCRAALPEDTEAELRPGKSDGRRKTGAHCNACKP